MTSRPCLDCGTPTQAATRCPDCRPPDHQLSAHQRGYDAAWRRLSRQARRLQNYCSDCDTQDDLTVDHTAEAWAAHEAGRRITLAMVTVVCRSCNSRRGAVRSERRAEPTPTDRGTDPPPTAPGPGEKPQGQLRMVPNSGGDGL